MILHSYTNKARERELFLMLFSCAEQSRAEADTQPLKAVALVATHDVIGWESAGKRMRLSCNQTVNKFRSQLI